jgi:hypothetical protein
LTEALARRISVARISLPASDAGRKEDDMASFQIGDRVEFQTTYPGHEGEIIQGVVFYVPTRFPGNIDVMTDFGQQNVLRSALRKVD